MNQGGRRLGAGRKTGSKTGSAIGPWNNVKELCDAVFAQHDPIAIANNLLTCGDAKVVERVWEKLLEYKFGKPVQPVSGADGGAIQVQIVSSIARPART